MSHSSLALSLSLELLPECVAEHPEGSQSHMCDNVCGECGREVEVPPDHGGCSCEQIECPNCYYVGYLGELCHCEGR